MALVLYAAPAAEPVSTTEAKSHLRVDHATDDTLIASLVQAAREMAEQQTRRALITQTWDLYLDDWPDGGELRLYLPPLQSVTSIQYTDSSGSVATFGTANYYVDTYREPGAVVLNDGCSWPATTLRETSGIQVRFTCGYGTAGSAVPMPIRQAILMATGHWYENRELATTAPVTFREAPKAFDWLLWPYRVYRWQ